MLPAGIKTGYALLMIAAMLSHNCTKPDVSDSIILF